MLKIIRNQYRIYLLPHRHVRKEDEAQVLTKTTTKTFASIKEAFPQPCERRELQESPSTALQRSLQAALQATGRRRSSSRSSLSQDPATNLQTRWQIATTVTASPTWTACCSPTTTFLGLLPATPQVEAYRSPPTNPRKKLPLPTKPSE